ncbi:MAG: Zn-ribbon domain-containing OB-fold protein [Acidimicrobiales bacterium]
MSAQDPVPEPGAGRPVREGLFQEGPEGWRLIGGRCAGCGQDHFPATSSCPWCSSEAVSEAELPDRGILWGWTAVTAAPPGYRGEVPFGFGVVELTGALRVVSRLTEADPGRLTFGQPMHLEVVPLHTDEEGRPVLTWAFAPG